MRLVDSSVWVDHLHRRNTTLVSLLGANQVLMHPFVLGEIAMGNLRDRERNLTQLYDIPWARLASDDEVLTLVSTHRLYGLGLGYIDAHLLAATRLTVGASLWTRDRRLLAAAERLGLAAG